MSTKPRLRWKKNPRPKGLAGICSGHPGHSLLYGKVGCANAYEHSWRGKQRGWYWTARMDPQVPLRNTCNETPLTEEEAKAAAMAYVRECLAKATEQHDE